MADRHKKYLLLDHIFIKLNITGRGGYICRFKLWLQILQLPHMAFSSRTHSSCTFHFHCLLLILIYKSTSQTHKSCATTFGTRRLTSQMLLSMSGEKAAYSYKQTQNCKRQYISWCSKGLRSINETEYETETTI